MTTGNTYGFKLQGVNFNGKGPISSSFTFWSCTKPSGQTSPTISSTAKQEIDLSWSLPSDNGGCSIIGFNLYMDDGNLPTSTGTFTSLSSTLTTQPYARYYQ